MNESTKPETEPAFFDILEIFEGQGPYRDTRTDVDTASLTAAYERLADVSIRNLTIAGPHGEIPARHYTTGPAQSALVWMHGGAFVGGSLDQPEANWVALELASRGVSVLSVDYRKAVRGVSFPIPSDDVLAAWLWACDHAEELEYTPGNLHLGGASAGGALAAGATLRLRDGAGTLPASLILSYSLVHPELPPASPEFTALLPTLPADRLLPDDAISVVNTNFAGSEEALKDPYAFAGVGTLQGHPPTFILNAEGDTLRASGEKYAAQLEEAGVMVRLELEPGTLHGYLDDPHSLEARRSIDRIRAWLRESEQVASS